MKAQRSLAVVTVLILGCVVSVYSQNTRRDGNWWNDQPAVTKYTYMLGFFDGMFLGRNFAGWGILITDNKLGKAASEDQTFMRLKSSFDEYQKKYMSNVTSGQLADGLDDFYKDYRNRSIEVDDAVWPVLKQIAGDPKQDVDALVMNLRKNAQSN